MIIRPERSEDADAIRAVHRAAFQGEAEAAIVDALRGTPAWIVGGSLVAEARGAVIGHALLTRADVVATGGQATGIGLIGPVGVLPAHQGRGAGSALTRAAISVAEAASLAAVCLLGHADYYPRFGFEPARALGLDPPRPWPDPSWLALRLPGWNPEIRGRVNIPPVFLEE